jgi:predicted nucleic acid-binding protein
MIAATAVVRGLTVATCNVRDYKRFGKYSIRFACRQIKPAMSFT